MSSPFCGTETFKHTPTKGNQMRYRYSNTMGQSASLIFDPVWTLVEAERSAKR